jgi:hypothetical protein
MTTNAAIHHCGVLIEFRQTCNWLRPGTGHSTSGYWGYPQRYDHAVVLTYEHQLNIESSSCTQCASTSTTTHIDHAIATSYLGAPTPSYEYLTIAVRCLTHSTLEHCIPALMEHHKRDRDATTHIYYIQVNGELDCTRIGVIAFSALIPACTLTSPSSSSPSQLHYCRIHINNATASCNHPAINNQTVLGELHIQAAIISPTTHTQQKYYDLPESRLEINMKDHVCMPTLLQ